MMRSALRRVRAALFPLWMDDWRTIEAALPTLNGLHIGCGPDRVGGLTRLDLNPAVAPDVLWDLEKIPYPFPDASFDIVVAINIVEHLHDTFDVIGEIHRLLKPGGRLVMLCPHFSSASAHTDPTHIKFLSARSFDYFIEGTGLCTTYGYYVSYRMQLARRRVSLAGIWGWVPGLAALISRRPGFWEDHLCYVVRGAGLYFELVKPGAA